MSHALKRFKQRLQEKLWRGPFYSLVLGGPVPNDVVHLPVEPHRGNAASGRALLKLAYRYGGQVLKFTPSPMPDAWLPRNAGGFWQREVAACAWLYDFATVGGTQARRAARQALAHWLQAFRRWHPYVWRADIIGARVCTWLVSYNALIASAPEGLRRQVLDSLSRQLRHLERLPAGALLKTPEPLQAVRGLIYGGLCLPEGERWLQLGLALLDTALTRTFDNDGMHLSRNSCRHVAALRDLVDLRRLLRQTRCPVPESLDMACKAAAQMLQILRLGDGGLVHFHGSHDGKIAALDNLLAQMGPKVRLPHLAPRGGFLRIQGGRSLLIADVASRGRYDSLGAFSFSHGKDRLITQCGGRGLYASNDGLCKALQQPAAHSRLSYANTNTQSDVAVITDKGDEGVMLTVEDQDGHILQSRCLLLANDGQALQGLDKLSRNSDAALPTLAANGELAPAETSQEIPVTLRFHLHPKVNASLIKNQTEILLRSASGKGWRFTAEGRRLTLEEGLYLEDTYSNPRHAQQIVLREVLVGAALELSWVLKVEG